MSALRLFDKFQKLLDVTWGSIADGQTLKRSGSNIIGYTPGGGSGDVVGPASAVNGNVASYNGTTGKLIADGAKLAADLVVGSASSVDSEMALFSGTGGKTIKRATGTGYVTVVSGVYQTPTAVDMAGRMPRGHLWGLTLSNNGTDLTNDIDIAAGEARDSTNTVDMVLAASITKRLDAAWAVGNNQGGLDTGSIANTTYHVWLIERTDGTVTDILFSASASAPTMPANYTLKRRIGSIIRSAAAIVRFNQYGNRFDLYAYSNTVISPIGTTAVLQVVGVPTGLKMLAHLSIGVWGTGIAPSLMVTSPDQADLPPDSATGFPPIYAPTAGYTGLAVMTVVTNTSAQIRLRSDTASTELIITNLGWFDTRGRED